MPHAPHTPPPLPAPTPLAVDASGGVVLVGGTFDPVHVAHTGAGVAVREALLPGGALVFVPAARSPHKAEGPVASEAHRVAMVRAAIADMPRATVWTDEIDRASAGEPSYWVQTLRRVRGLIRADAPVWFVVGQDQAESLHTWREAREVVRLARPAVVPRGSVVGSEPLAGLTAWTERERSRFAVVRAGPWEVSSSMIRSRIGDGGVGALGSDDLRSALHPRVAALIEQWGVYVP